MIRPNNIERDLITKFIDAARSTIPGTQLNFVEKYSYDDDIYLRIGLNLPEAIDADSPKVELIQKLASSTPVHPKYQLSIAFTLPSDSAYELDLDFLQRTYLSENAWNKKNTKVKFWDSYFKQQWIIRGAFPVTLLILISMAIALLLVITQPPYMLVNLATWRTESDKNAHYFAFSESMRGTPEQSKLTETAKAFLAALKDYYRAADKKENSKNLAEVEGARRQILSLYELIEKDPYINIAPGDR